MASASANSRGSGQTLSKKLLTSTTQRSTDMKPIVYITSPDSLDTSSRPILSPGWCLIASRSTRTIWWVVFVLSSRLWCKNDGRYGLAERFKDPEVKRGCEGMFPMDVPKNTRFAINYFTSIGLGVITNPKEMREYLKVRSSATLFFF